MRLKINYIFFLACILFSTGFSATEFKDSVITDSSKVVQKNEPKILTPKYLQILTNPYTVDIFVNKIHPDFANQPDYVNPALIEIPRTKNNVLITLFQREYADTTINVTLSTKDTSYLIVALRQHYDDSITIIQDRELTHRSKRSLGKMLLITSGAPFIASAISAFITHKYIQSANNSRSHIQNSIIRNGENYEQHLKNYNDNCNNAKTAKKISAISLGTALTLMSVGIILSF